MLAIGECSVVPPALHFARQNLRLTDEVTMYTNGDKKLAADLKTAVENPPVPQMKIESRKIVKFEKGPHNAEVIIHFGDGTAKTEAFVAHKPAFKLKGDLHKKLGLETTPFGTVKTKPPFNQTSMVGVYACGDMVLPMQTVTQAMFSRSAAGAGAVMQLQANQLGQQTFPPTPK